MNGSSGASIIIEGDTTTKTGNVRVGDQGYWLAQHAPIAMPRVIAVSNNWYSMETLFPLDPRMTHRTLLRRVVMALAIHIWPKPAVNKIDHVAHTDKMLTLCDEYEWGVLVHLGAKFDWANLATGLTHGDPTLENVMRRANGNIVLIDPIPSTPAVPDLISVDTGKLLQSIIGYEEVRYDMSRRWNLAPIDLRHACGMNDNEWAATCYWAAVHLLRAIPYAPQWARSGLRRLMRSVPDLV